MLFLYFVYKVKQNVLNVLYTPMIGAAVLHLSSVLVRGVDIFKRHFISFQPRIF